MPWLSRTSQSRSTVAAETCGMLREDQQSMVCSFDFGRLYMLLCQRSDSLVNTVHLTWFLCLLSHTDPEDTPNSSYSWVANSMTEKPPIDERHAKVIEVMERQVPSGHKCLRRARCKRGGWDRCQSIRIFRQCKDYCSGLLQKSKLATTSSPPSSS